MIPRKSLISALLAVAAIDHSGQPREGRTPHLDGRLAERIERERKRAAFGAPNSKRGLKAFRG